MRRRQLLGSVGAAALTGGWFRAGGSTATTPNLDYQTLVWSIPDQRIGAGPSSITDGAGNVITMATGGPGGGPLVSVNGTTYRASEQMIMAQCQGIPNQWRIFAADGNVWGPSGLASTVPPLPTTLQIRYSTAQYFPTAPEDAKFPSPDNTIITWDQTNQLPVNTTYSSYPGYLRDAAGFVWEMRSSGLGPQWTGDTGCRIFCNGVQYRPGDTGDIITEMTMRGLGGWMFYNDANQGGWVGAILGGSLYLYGNDPGFSTTFPVLPVYPSVGWENNGAGTFLTTPVNWAGAPLDPASSPLPGTGTTHTVGSGGNFATIEAAVQDSSVVDGDTILVLAGTFGPSNPYDYTSGSSGGAGFNIIKALKIDGGSPPSHMNFSTYAYQGGGDYAGYSGAHPFGAHGAVIPGTNYSSGQTFKDCIVTNFIISHVALDQVSFGSTDSFRGNSAGRCLIDNCVFAYNAGGPAWELGAPNVWVTTQNSVSFANGLAYVAQGNNTWFGFGENSHNFYFTTIGRSDVTRVVSVCPVEAHAYKDRGNEHNFTDCIMESPYGSCINVPNGGKVTVTGSGGTILMKQSDGVHGRFYDYGDEIYPFYLASIRSISNATLVSNTICSIQSPNCAIYTSPYYSEITFDGSCTWLNQYVPNVYGPSQSTGTVVGVPTTTTGTTLTLAQMNSALAVVTAQMNTTVKTIAYFAATMRFYTIEFPPGQWAPVNTNTVGPPAGNTISVATHPNISGTHGLPMVAASPPLATFTDSCNQIAISSITQTGGLATATTTLPHGLAISATPQLITIAGASPAAYNNNFASITVTGASTFTYAVPSGTASPATGTITWTIYPQNVQFTWSIGWGDGSTSTNYDVDNILTATGFGNLSAQVAGAQSIGNTNGPNISVYGAHTYASAGSYTVTVIVSELAPGTGTATTTLTATIA